MLQFLRSSIQKKADANLIVSDQRGDTPTKNNSLSNKNQDLSPVKTRMEFDKSPTKNSIQNTDNKSPAKARSSKSPLKKQEVINVEI